jgi:hypothetical protein
VWPLIVNTDSVTGQLIVDEVAIAQAPGAPVTATVFAPTAISAQGAATVPQIALFPSQYSETGYVESEDLDATCYLPYRVAANEPVRSVSVELARDGEPAALLGTVAVDAQDFQQSVSVRVRLRVPASLLSNGDNVLSVVENDSPSPVASAKFVRQSFADAIAVALRDTRLRLAAVTMDAKRKHLRSNAYVNLGLTVASRFVDRVGRPDIESLQSDYWSFLQLRETEQVLSQTQALIDRPLADVPSVGSSRPKIVNGVFVLQRNGADLPVFYGGYGAFGQVIKDLPTLPSLGATIVQQEAGPNTLDANGIDQGGLARMLDKLKAAHQNGVMVDMLLSPHYFPQWAISQYPDIGIKAHSFIQYDIDHPKAREIIEKWLRTAVSAVKDQPALFSFCLANEPVYVSSGRDVYSKPLFAAYLQREHGSIGNLNSLYKTNYTSFDDVPVPDANVPGFDQPVETMRAYYDWMTFNQQHFADWHTWMNGIIKSIAPSVPTHDKIMAGRVFDRGFLGDGIDPELYEDFTDIAGNDDYASVPGEPTGTANDAHLRLGERGDELRPVEVVCTSPRFQFREPSHPRQVHQTRSDGLCQVGDVAGGSARPGRHGDMGLGRSRWRRDERFQRVCLLPSRQHSWRGPRVAGHTQAVAAGCRNSPGKATCGPALLAFFALLAAQLSACGKIGLCGAELPGRASDVCLRKAACERHCSRRASDCAAPSNERLRLHRAGIGEFRKAWRQTALPGRRQPLAQSVRSSAQSARRSGRIGNVVEPRQPCAAAGSATGARRRCKLAAALRRGHRPSGIRNRVPRRGRRWQTLCFDGKPDTNGHYSGDVHCLWKNHLS